MKKISLLLIGFVAAVTLVFVVGSHIATAGAADRDSLESVVPAGNYNCSDGWRITGYYTPVETDYTSTEVTEIVVARSGKMSFNNDFLRAVFDDDKGYGEGWGKTRFGWYLGNYNGRWHKADAPLDANDKPLEANTVAVDTGLIPAGSTVNIPELPGDLGKLEFRSNDVGVSVHGKHVDVYTGEGREARRRMYRFTYEEEDKGLQRVCFSPPKSNH